jgi:integrase
MKHSGGLSTLLDRFWIYLELSRGYTPATVRTYKAGWGLLYKYAFEQRRILPTALAVEDLTPEFVQEFLNHLEVAQGNSPSTRNNRLAAIQTFFRFLTEFKAVTYAGQASLILAIRSKRAVAPEIKFLTKEEATLFLTIPNVETWCGIRDRAMFTLMLQTALRSQEVRNLMISDVCLSPASPFIKIRWGKGRKDRTLPLKIETVQELQNWLKVRDGGEDGPLFLSTRRGALSEDALGLVVTSNMRKLWETHQEVPKKNITPHKLRHTAAMLMFEDGVDIATISLFLGHEDVNTTIRYLHHSLKIKERAMYRTTFPTPPPGAPDDSDRRGRFVMSDADRTLLKRLK